MRIRRRTHGIGFPASTYSFVNLSYYGDGGILSQRLMRLWRRTQGIGLPNISYSFDLVFYYGEGGIRTHGTLAGSTVFKTARFNRSRTSPKKSLIFLDLEPPKG